MSIDVLVVGAGPTGLLMAAEIRRHGLNCRIIDQSDTTYSDLSRAVAIQARSLEIFDQLGIVDDFLQEGLAIKRAAVVNKEEEIGQLLFKDLNSPYPFVLSLEQQKTEAILEKYLNSQNIEVERNTKLIQIKQEEKNPIALISHDGREKTVHASWIIGCDGAHSQVRKQLNFAFEGKQLSHMFGLADIHIHWEKAHDTFFAFPNSEGILAAIPLPEENRYRLIFQLKKNDPEPTLQSLQDKLKKYTASTITLTNPICLHKFAINSRMVKHYQKGRVFLAGDAAHIHSPIGGQGMNTGLQDAYNLAWKIAYVHKKKAASALLTTYTQERHYVGQQLIRATEKANFFATLHNPLLSSIRNLCVKKLLKRAFFQKFLIQALSQIALRYHKNWVNENHDYNLMGPKVGQRAPNISIGSSDLYTKLRKSTDFHLLIFGKENNTPFRAQLIENNSLYGSEMLYLIRPDGYISFKAKNINQKALTHYLQRTQIKEPLVN